MKPRKYEWQGPLLHALTVMLLLVLSPHAAANMGALEKQRWVEVSTQNFRILTDHKPKKAVKIATNLERFRLAYQILFGRSIESRGMPLKVIAPRKRATFQLLAGEDQRLQQTVGFFLNNNSGNYATVEAQGILGSKSTSRQTSLSSLFHEYVHYLASSLYSERLPYWYSEGFAEYLSSIQFRGDDEISVGLHLGYHTAAIANTPWMSMERVLNSGPTDFTDQTDIQRVYSQGWLMVHYFSHDDERAKQLSQLVGLLTRGTAVEHALLEALGRDYDDLDRELKAYARKGRFPYSKFTLKSPLTAGELAVKDLSTSELLYELGEFFLNGMRRKEEAQEYFARSLQLDERNANALAGLARIAMEVDLATAEQQINEALAIEGENQWVNTVAGHIYNQRLQELGESDEQSPLRNKTIGFYNKAINGGNLNVEAIAAAANLYYLERNFERAKELLEMAYEFAPASAQIKVDLIRVYYALGDFESGDAFAELQRRGNHGTLSELEQFNEWARMARAEAKRYFDAVKERENQNQ